MKYDLKYFILRTNSILLYREAIKACFSIKDLNTRNELIYHVRSEYDNSKHITDSKKIEYALGIARKKITLLKESLHLSN